ncbi:hypothetical protein PHLCEN_2v3915 [Hermanssonia centrifuga]|uniref:Uncharacterized protein n=1 Tax=Hermanssonia centrifuga TaxID=98765 RepID=A0A2R6QB44_9APHY|nr:hypothetical protein PHLCEN_2v3915 [Hermanssonia centrifuga]
MTIVESQAAQGPAADPGCLAAFHEDNDNEGEFEVENLGDAQEELPHVYIDDLRTAYDFIDGLRNATLENGGLSEASISRLQNPLQESLDLEDCTVLLSIDIFLTLDNASEDHYNRVRDAIS